jgi:hypothetical protein
MVSNCLAASSRENNIIEAIKHKSIFGNEVELATR